MNPGEFIRQFMGPASRNGCLWHFTDAKNLLPIRQHGLLSTRTLGTEGIKPAATGGNEISLREDRRRGMDGYVHLTFLKGHPMEYRAVERGNITDLVRLKVKPEVLLIGGVKMTMDVSNKKGVFPISLEEGLDYLDREIIYEHAEWGDSVAYARLTAARKCELLVPDKIDKKFIINL